MNDAEYLQHNQALLLKFATTLEKRTQSLHEDNALRELAMAFIGIADGSDNIYSGAALASRLFTTFPEFAPTFPRQLLWFYGGECLHYMPDEEIEVYQQLEEQRLEAAAKGEQFNFTEARANLLQLQ